MALVCYQLKFMLWREKGISMEINAISTLLFAVIVLGILGYYLIQYVINKKKLIKRGVK